MPPRRPLALAILMSAALAIAGAMLGADARWMHYLFKPATTILIFWSVQRCADPVGPAYRRAILWAMLLSLGGDVFLMLPATLLALNFELGLASFLLAHLCFLRAFTRDARLFGRRLPLLALVLVSGANLSVLWPTIPAALLLPVLAYMVCLVAMSAQAASRALQLQTRGSRLAALGTLSFLASDTMIAYDKFHAPLPAAPLLILATYYGALYLIALSVPRADFAPAR